MRMQSQILITSLTYTEDTCIHIIQRCYHNEYAEEHRRTMLYRERHGFTDVGECDGRTDGRKDRHQEDIDSNVMCRILAV